MNIGEAAIASNERLYGDTWITWFNLPGLAARAVPGQFVMIRCTDEPWQVDPLLPRPMSIHRVRPGATGREFSILYHVGGRGTAWLAARRPGDRAFLWGPLGHGFALGRTTQNLLLVGGGVGMAPLVWAAEEAVAGGRNVTLLMGARSADSLYPAHLLPPEVEVVALTDDGSAGRRGLVSEAFTEHLPWADQVFACGPEPMYREMARLVRGCQVRRSIQVLLEQRMACGTGICYGCAVETRRGRGGPKMRLVCRDGPRFDLREVFWG